MTNVHKIDRREAAFRQGMTLFHSGEPRPENTWSDDEWLGALNEGQAKWLGWMMARAWGLMKQDRVRDYIERGIDLPPGFND